MLASLRWLAAPSRKNSAGTWLRSAFGLSCRRIHARSSEFVFAGMEYLGASGEAHEYLHRMLMRMDLTDGLSRTLNLYPPPIGQKIHLDRSRRNF